jgi:chromosome partitioning protein
MAGKVFAVANEKGGVGKTTTSVQLGHELADRGNLVCIIDNDPSYDATTAMFGDDVPVEISAGTKPEGIANAIKLYDKDSQFNPVEVKKNLYVMGSTDSLSTLKNAELDPAYDFLDSIEMMLEKFDYIIIDCAPSFGMLFTAAMIAASAEDTGGGVLIPMVPDDLSFKAAKKVANRIGQMNKRLRLGIKILGVLANKVVNNPMPQSVKWYLSQTEEMFEGAVFKSQINQTVKISDAVSLQKKVADYAKKDSKPAKQIAALADEVCDRLKSNDMMDVTKRIIERLDAEKKEKLNKEGEAQRV